MKYLLRVFLFNTFSLWLVSQIIPAMVVAGEWPTLLFAGFILSILMLLVAPLLRILFIPINIITFGLRSWAVNVIVLYLLTVFVAEVTISPWTFPGASWAGFVIPSIDLSYTVSLIVVSLAVSFLANVLRDISEH